MCAAALKCDTGVGGAEPNKSLKAVGFAARS
jgi:hypothetical protein